MAKVIQGWGFSSSEKSGAKQKEKTERNLGLFDVYSACTLPFERSWQ